MATAVRCMLAIAAAVLLAGVSGCAGQPTAPTPLSYRERMVELERLFDENWAIVAQLHPAAVRPAVDVVRITSGDTWVTLMTECLHGWGVEGAVSASGSIDLPGEQRGSAVVDVAEFACDVEYPRKAVFDSYLSQSQLGALYAYDVGFLQPCLLSVGKAVQNAPTRKAFISGYYRGNEWSPYNGVTYHVGRDGSSPVLERCPAVPSWLGQ